MEYGGYNVTEKYSNLKTKSKKQNWAQNPPGLEIIFIFSNPIQPVDNRLVIYNLVIFYAFFMFT